MAFKKVTKPKIESNTDLGQVLNPLADTKLVSVESVAVEESISEEDFNRILNDLIEQQRDVGGAAYNALADEELYSSTGTSIDKDKLRALRNRNRFRAVQYQEEIQRYKTAYQRAMSEAGMSVPYDRDDNDGLYRFMGRLFGSTSAEVTTAQHGAFKEIQRASAKKESERYVTGAQSFTDVVRNNESLDLSDLGVKKPIDIDDVDISLVIAGIEIYENGSRVVGSEGIPLGAGLGMGYDSIMEAEEMNNSVLAVLGKVDEKNSYVDSLFSNGPGTFIDSEIAGRPQKFSLSEVWENCFDCFFKAWTPEADFVLSLDIELRVSGLLDVIKDLIAAIKYALDLPAIISSNMCSLMRMGVLCPIEIAFVIASLVALLRFIVSELIMGFGDFLQALIGAILTPLLNALEVAASFSVAPLNIYTGCVLNTILSADQVGWTGRFTKAQISDILNARNTNRVASIPEKDRTRLRQMSSKWKPELFAGLISYGGAGTVHSQIDLLDILGLANNIDPLAIVESALLESNSKLQNVVLWIKNALAGLKNYAKSKSIGRMELVAKIIALSTLIGVLIAIAKLVAGKVEVCNRVTDPGTGETFIEPTFTPEEFIELIGLPPLLTLQRLPSLPSDTIIVDGEPVPVPGNNSPTSVLVNTTTDERFTIINCEKGKVKTVSNNDIKATLRQLGLS